MDTFMKAAVAVLTTLILTVVLQRQGKEIALLLTIAVCAMVALTMTAYLKPVISFVERLKDIGNLDGEMLMIVLKTVGIGILSEVCAAVCSDSGNAALGKMLQLLAAVVILCMSIPLLEQLLDLFQEVLKGI